MPYRTEGRIEPPNNGDRARHALPHMASEWLTHWTTWAGLKLTSTQVVKNYLSSLLLSSTQVLEYLWQPYLWPSDPLTDD